MSKLLIALKLLSLFDQGHEAETGRACVVVRAVSPQVQLLVKHEQRLVPVGNSA